MGNCCSNPDPEVPKTVETKTVRSVNKQLPPEEESITDIFTKLSPEAREVLEN